MEVLRERGRSRESEGTSRARHEHYRATVNRYSGAPASLSPAIKISRPTDGT